MTSEEIWQFAAVGVVVILAVGTLFGFFHEKAGRIAQEDHAASNARVLREFKRMSVWHPEKIVDLTGRRRGDPFFD